MGLPEERRDGDDDGYQDRRAETAGDAPHGAASWGRIEGEGSGALLGRTLIPTDSRRSVSMRLDV